MITDADFTALEARCAKLEAILGDWTRQYSKEEVYERETEQGVERGTLLTKANELQNGEYPVAITQRRVNFILDALKKSTDTKPSGSISITPPVVGPAGPQGPKGDKGDTGPQGPAGSVSSGNTTVTPIAPELPGLGYGFHFKGLEMEAAVFIQDGPDYAMRFLTNHKASGFENGTHAIPTEGQQRIDIERFGIGLSYWPPLKNPDGSPFPASALDKQGGKGLVIANQDADGHRAPYVRLYTGLPGQGFQIGVSAGKNPDGSGMANVMVAPSIQIEPDGTKSIG